MSVAISIGEIPAFATRDDLVREVMDRLDRDGVDVTDTRVRSAIQLVEAEFNRNVRVPQMEALDSLALTSGSISLPSGFIALRALYDSDSRIIPAVDPMALIETPPGGTKVHCIIGGALKVAPAADETVTCLYYTKLPNLSADAQSNWLLDTHPDIYFYGTLTQLSDLFADDDNAAKYRAAFENAMGQLIDLGHRRRFGGPLMMRSNVVQTRGATI